VRNNLVLPILRVDAWRRQQAWFSILDFPEKAINIALLSVFY